MIRSQRQSPHAGDVCPYKRTRESLCPSLLSAMGGRKERLSVCNLEESSHQNQTVLASASQTPER